MMIKSRVKKARLFDSFCSTKDECIVCPQCRRHVILSDLVPYNGSGYTFADKAKRCPFCGFLTTLKDWRNFDAYNHYYCDSIR